MCAGLVERRRSGARLNSLRVVCNCSLCRIVGASDADRTCGQQLRIRYRRPTV